jgi:hypothetical protein
MTAEAIDEIIAELKAGWRKSGRAESTVQSWALCCIHLRDAILKSGLAPVPEPARKNLEYLRGRVKEITDELDHTALSALEGLPKGSNGPITIAAYESMVRRQRTAVHMLRAALMRADDANVIITDPEAAERL